MNPQKDHTPLIVLCLCLLACVSLSCATVLINKGYTAELMVGIAAGCASSLGTMLGQRRSNAGASGVEINNAGDINALPPPAQTQPPLPNIPQPTPTK